MGIHPTVHLRRYQNRENEQSKKKNHNNTAEDYLHYFKHH